MTRPLRRLAGGIWYIMERTGGNGSSILAQCWPRVVANQYNMQHDVVITRVGMMLVSKPIGGTNVNLDISHDVVGMLAGYSGKRLCIMMVVCEASDGVQHIWP